jgi:HD-GYP domain-containing protein (c-di-GMP phosphodiesterase class II)
MRPYRNPLPEEKALQEIKDYKGSQFDPRLVDAFLKLLPEYKKDENVKEEVVVARLIKKAA